MGLGGISIWQLLIVLWMQLPLVRIISWPIIQVLAQIVTPMLRLRAGEMRINTLGGARTPFLRCE